MSLPNSTKLTLCRLPLKKAISTSSAVSSKAPFSTAAASFEIPIVVVDNTTKPKANLLLGPNENFPLPGNVAIASKYTGAAISPFDINITKPERQVEEEKPPLYQSITIKDVMKSAHPKVQKNEDYEPEPIIEKLKSERSVEMTTVNCPKLLKRDLKHLFLDKDFKDTQVTVINLTQKSECDMSAWSPNMELERMKLTCSFVEAATEICRYIGQQGFWADFIDPTSGRPYLSRYTNSSLFETDDRYRHLGFQIEDLGCCKVLKHVQWGTNAFVGTIFTDAPLDADFVTVLQQSVNTSDTKF